jgi:hypothetical protein
MSSTGGDGHGRGRPYAPAAVELIGRDHELAEVAERVLGGRRLVTVIGPGGIGKTAWRWPSWTDSGARSRSGPTWST